MKKYMLIFLMAVLCRHSYAQTYNIILGRPTNNSVTASILFGQDVQYYLEFGAQAGTYSGNTTTAAATANVPVEVDMTGLTADTKYYYRLRYKAAGSSSFSASIEYSFHTQRASGSSFTFTIEADEHLYDIKGVKNLYQVCLNNQAADKPDFMLSLGDIFGDDHYPNTITSSDVDYLHKFYRQYLGSITHSVPFYVCLGNHEGENDFYLAQNPPNNLAVWSTLWRKYYYPNPYPNSFYSGNSNSEGYGMGQPENYYSWKWGDALFVVLDVYRDQCDTSDKPGAWAWTLGKPQYDWLKTTLETSTSKYKFVFAHHVRGQGRGAITNAKLYEWGGYEQNGTSYTFTSKRPGWAKPIQQLFKDNNVTIFFQGHDHLFAKEELDGVVYQEVPMPSDSTYSLGLLANGDAYTSVTQDGSGHIRVSVSPSCVKVDYVRAYLPADVNNSRKNGDVTYSYTIGTCSSSGGGGTVNTTGDVAVFPVPANAILNTQFSNTPASFNIYLYDLSGQMVLHSQSLKTSVAALPNGMYIAKIITPDYSVTKKVMVLH